MSMVRSVVGGVDTHADTHVAAAVDHNGGLLGIESFPASVTGYEDLLGWLVGFGPVEQVGVEGTGSWGVGLSRFLADHDVMVVEVDRPNRQKRRKVGKSDPTDALTAARAALSGEATVVPKTRNGPVEQIRVLMVARHFGPTKTYRRRMVIIPGFLRELMAEHLARNVDEDPDALVFTSPEGQSLRNSNFRRQVWYKAVADAGLPDGLRIHDLRHTCASLLIAQGAHPKAIQVHLGHSSISVTMDRYGHLFPSDMEALAVALDAARSRALADQMRTKDGPEIVALTAH